MSFLYLFLVGILIGTAMIVPGVSGAVIAVILGIYDKMIKALTQLFKDFKKNFIFLFILGLGILIGAIWFSNVLMFLYDRHEVITKFCFIGLILGGVPYLFKEIKIKGKSDVNYLAVIITFIISIGLLFISKNSFTLNVDSNSIIINTINLILSGIIYSIGKVVPGISGSFLLILIGMYEYVLSVLAHPITIGLSNLNKLIPFLVGLILGVISLLKIVNYLLNKHFSLIYSIIIGFVIGSILVLLPPFSLTISYFIGIILMLGCFLLSLKLIK